MPAALLGVSEGFSGMFTAQWLCVFISVSWNQNLINSNKK